MYNIYHKKIKKMKKLFIVAVLMAGSWTSFAQKAKSNSAENKTGTVITTAYNCPMHPDVTSDKPGKCSKCGMDLTLSKKEQLKNEVAKIYSCPMHPGVTSDKPGKCTKCGMNLGLSKKEQMKAEVVKLYSCPMHTEVVSNHPGTCAKCSSKLVVDRRGSKQGTTVYTCSMHPGEVSDKPGKCPMCGMAMETKNKKQ